MTKENQTGRRRSPTALSPEDQEHLERLEAKFQMVRDRVTGVVGGYDTGVYLHGEGGVGKSYTVLQQLRRLGADFILANSRMTGRGLFNQLQQSPSSVHLLEDIEPLLRDKNAQGVLRSALWAQRERKTTGPVERLVTWTTCYGDERFVYTGGLIMIGNRALDDVPELRAVKTRIVCVHLEATAQELQALMRHVARKGHSHNGKQLEPATCLLVCEHVIVRSLALNRSLDMRLLINALNDRLQWEEADAACHWTDLIEARLREGPAALQNKVECISVAARKQKEQKIVAEILAESKDPQEQRRLWFERTGKSPATWYRRRDAAGKE